MLSPGLTWCHISTELYLSFFFPDFDDESSELLDDSERDDRSLPLLELPLELLLEPPLELELPLEPPLELRLELPPELELPLEPPLELREDSERDVDDGDREDDSDR